MTKTATQLDLDQIDFEKGGGLIPAIVQDADDYRVLMLGYMNRDALETTLDKERVTFYSRSKERLWTKGETSEHYLNLVDIQADCDADTLLILAQPEGPVCHTGEKSCFFKKDFTPPSTRFEFLYELQSLLKDRKQNLPENSYTSSLFREGTDKIAQKVGEEAIETVIAAKNENREELQYESADLLFHLMMLLTQAGMSLEDLIEELEERR